MATPQTDKIEREYTIPLRSEWKKVPVHERTRKAVKAIKKFLAKHMKVSDRDVDKVKIDVYLNNEIWFKGKSNPPSKVKVRAIKENDIVKVTFVETPKHVGYAMKRNEKPHKTEDKKPQPKVESKPEEKTEEEKKVEVEKEKSGELQNIKQAEQQAKAKKHTTKSEKAQRPVRMALQK